MATAGGTGSKVPTPRGLGRSGRPSLAFLDALVHFALGMPNPVYPLDLTLFLPPCIITALLLWRDHPATPVLAAMVLVKKATLGLAILSMIVFQLAADEPANPVMVAIFAAITTVDLTLLAVGAARMRGSANPWLRRQWWPNAASDA
jgi:hypothetical protein